MPSITTRGLSCVQLEGVDTTELTLRLSLSNESRKKVGGTVHLYMCVRARVRACVRAWLDLLLLVPKRSHQPPPQLQRCVWLQLRPKQRCIPVAGRFANVGAGWRREGDCYPHSYCGELFCEQVCELLRVTLLVEGYVQLLPAEDECMLPYTMLRFRRYKKCTRVSACHSIEMMLLGVISTQPGGTLTIPAASLRSEPTCSAGPHTYSAGRPGACSSSTRNSALGRSWFLLAFSFCSRGSSTRLCGRARNTLRPDVVFQSQVCSVNKD